MGVSNKLLSTISIIAIGCAIGSQALAQQVPGSAEPSRVERQFRAPEFQSIDQPQINIPDIRIEGAPEGADKISFTLNSISFEGVTAYSLDELKEVYADNLGTKITLTEFYGIAERVNRKYRNDGYIISQVVVPIQTIDGGNAKLRVVEGYIDGVSVQGSEDDSSLKKIERIANNLTKKKPLTADALEKYLLIINDLPGVRARSIISPSQNAIGGADIAIIVERKTNEYLIGFDNYGTRFLGPFQITAASQFQNLLNMNERITIQGVTATPELYFGSAELQLPINDYGTTLSLDTSYTRTRPGFTLEIFDVEGESTRFGGEIEHPVIRTRNENLRVRARIDSLQQINEDAILPQREDDIRSLRLGANYQKINTFFGTSIDNFDIEFSKGFDVLGASKESDSTTRANGTANYYKINAEAQRLQRVSSDVNLLLGATGQWTSNELLASEEFGVGGLNYGRGFDASEIIGDRGYAAKVELQYSDPFRFIPEFNFTSSHAFAFYDVGTIWDDDATAVSERRNSIASTGFGFRADFTPSLNGDIYAAFPLTRDVQTTGDEDVRVFAGIRKTF